MTQRPFYFGSNFKMHQTAAESQAFVEGLVGQVPPAPDVQRFVIPPFTSLPGLPDVARPGCIWVGAQNFYPVSEGPFTGEISPPMLTALGIHLVLVGHAERRTLFGETDELVGRKVRAGLDAGLRVLLCVGETAAEKAAGQGVAVLTRQLGIALDGIEPEALGRLLVAYEPVWSIGARGTPAPVDYVAQAVASIRSRINGLFDDAGRQIPVLYGGSVNLSNCGGYAAIDGVDGLFVGRAAWTADGYGAVLQAGFAAHRMRGGWSS